MEKRPTSGYINIGTSIRYLLDSSAGYQVFGLGSIDENISRLRSRLEEYEFFVSMRIATDFGRLTKVWKGERAAAESRTDFERDRLLTAAEATQLKTTARILRRAILAEAAGKIAYVTTDRRYAVEKLLGDPASLMGEGVFESLPELARYDIEEGCKAIAFAMPTAGAFHLLRAVEAALRSFYEHEVKRSRIAEPRMWAAIIAALRAKRNPPPELLLSNLDSLRHHFRNPTQHPEKVYDLDEVQDLFALAVDAMNRMARHAGVAPA